MSKGKLFKCGSSMYMLRLICLSGGSWGNILQFPEQMRSAGCRICPVAGSRDAVTGRCLHAVVFFLIGLSDYCHLKVLFSKNKEIFAMKTYPEFNKSV